MNDGELTQVLERVESIEASIGQLQRSVARVLNRLDNAAPRLHTATFNSIEALIAVYHQLGSSATLPPLAGPFGGWSITPDMARVVCDLFTVYKPSQVLDLGSGVGPHPIAETPEQREANSTAALVENRPLPSDGIGTVITHG